jgi:hypothetical protein
MMGILVNHGLGDMRMAVKPDRLITNWRRLAIVRGAWPVRIWKRSASRPRGLYGQCSKARANLKPLDNRLTLLSAVLIAVGNRRPPDP